MDLERQKITFRVPRINILGVEVDDISQKKAVDAILSMAKDKKRSHQVVTVNSEMIMLARSNEKFRKILDQADLCVADGYWVAISKLILGGKEHERVAGVDLTEKLCEKSKDLPIRIGFLGGFGSIAEIVSKRQIAKNPGLKVILASPGDPAIGYDLRLKSDVFTTGRVDILFVAYGMGRQEFWIQRNRKKLDVGVFIGVWGAFDYLSGVKIRAPKPMQGIGMEWLWRLMTEPVRIWRMRVLPVFFGLILWEFLTKKLLKK